MRRTIFLALAGALCLLVPLTAGAAKQAPAKRTYVVLYERGASVRAAHAAIKRAGGRIVHENRKVGVATVRSANARFVSVVARSRAVDGAAQQPLDRLRAGEPRSRARSVRDRADDRPAQGAARRRARATRRRSVAAAEPFADLQWDMRLINATPSKSYKRQRGSHGVRVGIIDTGVDGSHPDIAPNFNRSLSRNFTTDIPLIDGRARTSRTSRASDAADVDEDGHGTHVAGTVAAPINGLGMAGVAPGVELVNIRAGQDSGYFFLQPSVDALTYAADIGVDVVNMSYYIDPWLYNCADNPADSPEEQLEQRTIIAATERALAYARAHGVTLVSAEGNGNTDLGKPVVDVTSPDYPPETERERAIDNSCKSEPLEAPGVLGITSVGPSTRKAYYSDYGVEQADLSAPGGDRRDFFGTSRYNTPGEHGAGAVSRSTTGDRQRRAEPGRHAQHAVRAGRLLAGRLRLLPVPAGHLDGVAARGRGGGAGGGLARPARQGPRRADALAGRGRAGAQAHGAGPRLPGPAGVHVPRSRPDAGLHGDLRGLAGEQRVLRGGHRGRVRRVREEALNLAWRRALTHVRRQPSHIRVKVR